jgi:hypothetical protein
MPEEFEEPPKRMRRTTVKPAVEVLTKPQPDGPWCRHCGAEFGVIGESESGNIVARQAETVLAASTHAAFGTEFACEACGAMGVPVFDKAAVLPARNYAPPPKLPAVQRIIDSVFEVDFGQTWKQLHDALVVGDHRSDLGNVRRSLDHAEDNARKAHKLYCGMRVELERYEIDAEIVFAPMRGEATDLLQAQKVAGTRTKQITDADVEATMAELHPDEYRRVKLDRKKFRLAVDHAEELGKSWNSRCRSLQSMLHSIRGGGVGE